MLISVQNQELLVEIHHSISENYILHKYRVSFPTFLKFKRLSYRFKTKRKWKGKFRIESF